MGARAHDAWGQRFGSHHGYPVHLRSPPMEPGSPARAPARLDACLIAKIDAGIDLGDHPPVRSMKKGWSWRAPPPRQPYSRKMKRQAEEQDRRMRQPSARRRDQVRVGNRAPLRLAGGGSERSLNAPGRDRCLEPSAGTVPADAEQWHDGCVPPGKKGRGRGNLLPSWNPPAVHTGDSTMSVQRLAPVCRRGGSTKR